MTSSRPHTHLLCSAVNHNLSPSFCSIRNHPPLLECHHAIHTVSDCQLDCQWNLKSVVVVKSPLSCVDQMILLKFPISKAMVLMFTSWLHCPKWLLEAIVPNTPLWSHFKENFHFLCVFQRVLLQRSSKEFKEIEALFCETMKGFDIVKIERIQNKYLWEAFRLYVCSSHVLRLNTYH